MLPLIKVTSLPLSQQIALWTILRIPNATDKQFSFLSSEFAEEFKRLASQHISEDIEEYGKFIGAILSGLARNGVLVKLTGDRDKLWRLSDDIQSNFDFYKEKLLEVKAYWR